MLNIVILGPQGSGRGTQADILSEKLRLPKVSIGQLLRAETDRETGLGREILKYTKTGELVPSDMIFRVVLDRLQEQDTAEGVIIDGYPRSVEQAGTLDDIMTKLERHVTDVFFLDITDEVAVERLAGRRVCSNPRCGRNYHVTFSPPARDGICDVCGRELVVRTDDNTEAVRHRLDIYHEISQPLVRHYEERKIAHKIDGNHTIAEVTAAMMSAMGISG